MSQENVEIVTAFFDAMNRGDLDAAYKDAAPNAELDLSQAVGLERSVYRIDELRRLSEEFAESWESARYEAHEFIDTGEHVVTPWTNYFVGRDGIEVEARGTWLWTIRNGLVVRVCLYQDLEEALEAVGLSE